MRGKRESPKIVAGADISFTKNSSRAFAGVVLLNFPSLEVAGEFTTSETLEKFNQPILEGMAQLQRPLRWVLDLDAVDQIYGKYSTQLKGILPI